MKKGFTLIELLVVVLIIGILSAVALPQYTKAVEKSRAVEAITVLSSLQRAVDIYLMENGFPNGELFLPPAEPSINLSIDLPSNLEHDEESSDGAYKSKHFVYSLWCTDEGCSLLASREDPHDQLYILNFWRSSDSQQWERTCDPINELGISMCRILNL